MRVVEEGLDLVEGDALGLGHLGGDVERARDRLALARRQCQLPISKGGMGLASASHTRHLAYVAAWADFLNHDAHPLTHDARRHLVEGDNDAVDALHDAWRFVEAQLRVPGARGHTHSHLAELLGVASVHGLRAAGTRIQSKMSEAVGAVELATLLGKVTNDDKVRLTACAGPLAGGVLYAFPMARELRVHNAAYADVCRVRLGLPLPFLAHSHAKTCTHSNRHGPASHHEVDPFGNHEHVCPHSGRTRRHNLVQQALTTILTMVGIANSKCDHNTLKIHPNDPLNDCPDVEFALPSLGCPVLADVAVAHPLASSYSTIYKEAGSAADKRAQGKRSKSVAIATDDGRVYERMDNVCAQRGFDFRPFTIETFGAWGKDARRTLRLIEREALDFDTRPTASWTASHIRALSEQLIGVALAKGLSDQLRSGNRRRVGNKHQAAHRGPAYLPCEYAMGPSLSQDPMAYHPCGSNIDGHEDDMWQAPFDGDDHDNLSPSPSPSLSVIDHHDLHSDDGLVAT